MIPKADDEGKPLLCDNISCKTLEVEGMA